MAPRGCAAHCRCCGICFATDSAFDAHRVGRHDLPAGHPQGRRCINPGESKRFEAIEGVCSISAAPRIRRGVEVYRLNGAAAQRSRERLQRFRS